MSTLLLNDFVTLFVVIDPIGTVPFLLALTRKMTAVERRRVCVRGVAIATIVLLGFAVFGHVLLRVMGISFSSFRIAGGVILFLVGVQMVFAKDHEDDQKHPGHEIGRDVAVFPIALPYIAGPGSMLAVMVQTQQEQFDLSVLAGKVAMLILALAATLATLLSASHVYRLVGKTGSEVIGRVMGIILAALAAESVVRGILDVAGT